MTPPVLFYLSMTYVCVSAIGLMVVKGEWSPFLTAPYFFGPWLIGTGLYFGAWGVRRRIDWRDVATRLPDVIAFVAVLVVMQSTFHSIKTVLGTAVRPFIWDITLHRIDVAIHGKEPWAHLSGLLGPQMLRSLDVIYVTWVVVAFVFTAWCCWTVRRPLRDRARVSWVLLWVVGGTVWAWSMPAAGPAFFKSVVGGTEYAALVDRLDSLGPSAARTLQDLLWRAHEQRDLIPFGGLTAMPSLHVAAAALVAIVAWHRWWPLGVALAGYATLIQLGSVALGWHYAVDGYAGVLLASVCWWLAGGMCGRRRGLQRKIPGLVRETPRAPLSLSAWAAGLTATQDRDRP